MLLILSFELIGSKTYTSPHSPILKSLEIIGLPPTEKAPRSLRMEDKVQINGTLMVYKALCQPPVLKRGKGEEREGEERKEGEEEQEEQEEKKE